MYGVMFKAAIEKLVKEPPVNALKKLNASLTLLLKICSITLLFVPGTGSCDAKRITTNIPSVNNNLFLISLILLKVLLFALDFLIKKIPIVQQANGVLGAMAGLLNGLIWTWALSNVFVKFLLPVLNHLEPDFFIMEIADSYIIHLCTKINPITYLFELINLIS